MKNISILLVLLMLTGCASMVRNGTILRAEDNFQDGDYENVISIVERAVRSYEFSDEDTAKLLYLKAASYVKLGDIRSSIALLQYIVHKYPGTEYGFLSNSILESLVKHNTSSEFEI